MSVTSLAAGSASVTIGVFGKIKDGREAHLYRLVNASGMSADISDYGGIVVRLLAPDRHGRFADVVLGCATLDDYVKASPYFGAIVGRYANRIARGKFSLDAANYTLATNNGPSHLHGGNIGYDKVLWTATPLLTDNTPGLELRYRSADGEEGYPGNVDLTVRYWLTNDNGLKIEYHATVDQATPLNLTNHTYFNLKGEGSGDILDHVLTLKAARYTPVDADLIPTGELAAVGGTPFDFTTPHLIGERIAAAHEQLKLGHGYDHNWVLDHPPAQLSLAASVDEPASGRRLEVWTEEPGVQLYTANFLGGTGKSGRAYAPRGAFCLETQHFPDSPNRPNFPSTIVRPGTAYHTTTIYKFLTR